jgi:hypothetical protein
MNETKSIIKNLPTENIAGSGGFMENWLKTFKEEIKPIPQKYRN